ncbi:hypothetical protein CVT25_005521 [Psilocybe cyanescens]|uniref:Uncharacterized protein n=1 Tax=Psilocybe cyanescens TaxID=93625 RepID=A0A409XS72_PSICY|nr:hypothetical protein CVT25_005521 [Psilocybe cyanescens]
MTVFLKGYRLDMFKISKTVPLEPNSRPDDWVIPIVDTIPRDAYKRVQNGYESDNSLNVMIVLEDGVDEQELMRSPVTSSDKTLVDIGCTICTPGIWPSFDSSIMAKSVVLEDPKASVTASSGMYYSRCDSGFRPSGPSCPRAD